MTEQQMPGAAARAARSRDCLFAPLVGSRFVPPAMIILNLLPQNCKVELVPEQSNPYDSGAIVVQVRTEQIPADELRAMTEDLLGQGFSPEDLAAKPSWPLGHLAASGGKPLAKMRNTRPDLIGTAELASLVPCEAELRFEGEFVLVVVAQ